MPDFEQEREVSSKVQIKELNESRPRPTPKLEYTIQGSIMRHVMSHEAAQENARIDGRVEAMQRRLAKRKNQARDDFTKVKDNDLGR